MFEERKRAITREENVKFVDFKDLALQPCSLAALQPCSLAGYVNLNYLNFPKYFPPDINFFEENLMFVGTTIQYLPVK
ncbi:hypothetical protein MP659_000916 [Salmonella enterica]|nr:hypothetical protein [Salmonella enterica subsp. enterica serovar Benin]EGG5310564.1 hypothetical protein [Salmonella enterica]EIZ5128413.1 hypothetical protein [Salmonella enterica]EKZ3294791.1 hypothetical protein [Salmonella enterica]